MGLFSSWRSKANALDSTAANKGKLAGLDLFMATIASDVRLDDNIKDSVYRKILERAERIIIASGQTSDFNESFFKYLAQLIRKRRGITWPEELNAAERQRYREIGTLAFTLTVVVKVLAKLSIGKAVKVQHQGVVHCYPVYREYIYKQFEYIGLTESEKFVSGPEVEFAVRVTILNELLFASSITMQWLGQFPDIERLVYRSLLERDDTKFSSITDEFIKLILGDNKVSAKSGLLNANTAPNLSVQSPAAENVEKPSPQPEVRKPLTAGPGVLGLLEKAKASSGSTAQQSRDAGLNQKVAKPVFTENSASPTSGALKLNSKIGALLRAKAEPKSDGDDQPIGVLSSDVTNCLRSVAEASPPLTPVLLVDENGEVVLEKGLELPYSAWKAIAVKCDKKFKSNEVRLELEALLVKEGCLFANCKGGALLTVAEGSVLVININNVTEKIFSEHLITGVEPQNKQLLLG